MRMNIFYQMINFNLDSNLIAIKCITKKVGRL